MSPDEVRQLPDARLIEMVTGRRTSRRVEDRPVPDLRDLLTDELEPRLYGMTPGQVDRIQVVREVVRRVVYRPVPDRVRLQSPEEVAALMGPRLALHTHEVFICLALDPRSRLIGQPIQVSQGDIDGTEAGPRAFFRLALRAGAHSAVAVHNHPTGDPSPSAQDLAVTRRLVAAGRLVDITLSDHLVVGSGFTSLRREQPELFA